MLHLEITHEKVSAEQTSASHLLECNPINSSVINILKWSVTCPSGLLNYIKVFVLLKILEKSTVLSDEAIVTQIVVVVHIFLRAQLELRMEAIDTLEWVLIILILLKLDFYLGHEEGEI